MITIKKRCKGVRVTDRNTDKNDLHQMIEILTEDDEQWFVSDSFSTYWLDELIDSLTEARTLLQSNPSFKKTQWGFERIGK